MQKKNNCEKFDTFHLPGEGMTLPSELGKFCPLHNTPGGKTKGNAERERKHTCLK